MLTCELNKGERDMPSSHSFSNHKHWGPLGTLPDLDTNLDCRIWDAKNSEMNSPFSHNPMGSWRVCPGRWSIKERGKWQGKGKLSSYRKFTFIISPKEQARQAQNSTMCFHFVFCIILSFSASIQLYFKKITSERWTLPRKCISLQMKIREIAGSFISCRDIPLSNKFNGWHRNVSADRLS